MSKKYRRFIPLCFLSLFTSFCYAAQYYEIRGTVIDRITREPVPYASVAIWNSSFGSVADSIGQYRLVQIPPGIYRIQVSCLGYQTYTTPEFKVTTHNLLQDIELTESKTTLEEVSVTGNRFRHSTESPIAMRVIGIYRKWSVHFPAWRLLSGTATGTTCWYGEAVRWKTVSSSMA